MTICWMMKCSMTRKNKNKARKGFFFCLSMTIITENGEVTPAVLYTLSFDRDVNSDFPNNNN